MDTTALSVETIIADGVKDALKALYNIDIDPATVNPGKTRKEFAGDLTVMVFPWVKQARKAPEAVGTEIGQWLKDNVPAVEDFNVVKGFLNLVISPKVWVNVLESMLAEGENFGFREDSESSPLVMVEYSSPNTNKPLHLGHVRNNLLGHSLAEILKACGNRVIKTNIVNDRGIHICKSMIAWLRYGDGVTPESSGKKGDHLVGDFYVAFDKHYRQQVKELVEKGMPEDEAKEKAPLMQEAREMLRKWEENDPETRALWQKMNSWVYAGFDETYRRMGVSFDKIYYESQTYLEGKEKVLEGLEKGLFEKHDDGSVWADLTGDGLDKKILLRSDGTSVYMTQDIGTAKMRFQDYPIDKMIYVVGNEQNYHFQVLSLLLDRLGFHWGKGLVHFSYGMVELPEGKMKSREGTVVDADDLMDTMIEGARALAVSPEKVSDLSEAEIAEISRMVGLGALKYFLLKVDPRKNMLFNPKESIDFNGNTGPFIQYTYARIRSLIAKAAAAGITAKGDATKALPGDKETEVIKKLAAYPQSVAEAGRSYSPALIANYIYDLAKEYNSFYHDYPILKEADANAAALRVEISKMTADVLKSGCRLLGIEVPEKM